MGVGAQDLPSSQNAWKGADVVAVVGANTTCAKPVLEMEVVTTLGSITTVDGTSGEGQEVVISFTTDEAKCYQRAESEATFESVATTTVVDVPGRSSLHQQSNGDADIADHNGENILFQAAAAKRQQQQQQQQQGFKSGADNQRTNGSLVVSPPPSPTPSSTSSTSFSSLSSSSEEGNDDEKEESTMTQHPEDNQQDDEEEEEAKDDRQTLSRPYKQVNFDGFVEVILIGSRQEMGGRSHNDSYYSPYEMESMRERERQLVRDISLYGTMQLQQHSNGRWKNEDVFGVEGRVARYHRRQRIRDAICSVLLEQELLVQTTGDGEQQDATNALNGENKNIKTRHNADLDLALAEVYQEYTYESTRLAIHRAKVNAIQVGSSDTTTDQMMDAVPSESFSKASLQFCDWRSEKIQGQPQSSSTHSFGEAMTENTQPALPQQSTSTPSQQYMNVSFSTLNSPSSGIRHIPNQAEERMMRAMIPGILPSGQFNEQKVPESCNQKPRRSIFNRFSANQYNKQGKTDQQIMHLRQHQQNQHMQQPQYGQNVQHHQMTYPVPYTSQEMAMPAQQHQAQVWSNVAWDPATCQYVHLGTIPGQFVGWPVQG